MPTNEFILIARKVKARAFEKQKIYRMLHEDTVKAA